MISYQDALQLIESVAAQYFGPSEKVRLQDSLGRILHEEVISPESIPSFNNSAMDGFAVVAADTKGASLSTPIKIPVKGMIAAGDLKALQLYSQVGGGVAIEIMTGAPVPPGGPDTVIKIEDVTVIRDDQGKAISITLTKPVTPGENIRLIGTDYQKGQKVLPVGIKIAPEHILGLSSLGVASLNVKKWPKIAIVCTGSELVPSDTPTLEPGMIRNSTGDYMVASLRRMGIEAKFLGIVHDDPSVYQKTIQSALDEGVDLILSTGAVSMGQFDFVSDVLNKMEAVTHFHKASIRPGKPILFAEFKHRQKGAVIFGIPGNPVSTAVGLRFFVEPYIRKMLNLPREKPVLIKVNRELSKPHNLRCFYKGKTRFTDQGLEVEALRSQASYVVSSLTEANCWVVFTESGDRVLKDSLSEVYPLNNSFELGVLS
jgi:molybdopterin molybdotransferase